MLRSFYRKGWNSWRKGVERPPFAFVIPEDQGDRRRVAQLVGPAARPADRGRPRAAAVRGGRGPFAAGQLRGAPRPALPQLRRRPAHCPRASRKDGRRALRRRVLGAARPLRPRGRAHRGRRASRAVRLAPCSDAPQRRPAPSRRRDRSFLLADTGQEALLAARYAPGRVSASRSRKRAFRADGHDVSAPARGCCPAQDGLADARRAVAGELAPRLRRRRRRCPTWRGTTRPLPRLGVWVPWADTDSIGWVRYMLDRRRVPYVYVRDEDIRAGALREQVDVIALRPRATSSWPSRSTACPGLGPHALQEDAASTPATARRRRPTTSRAASAGPAWPSCSSSWRTAGCW